MSTGISTFARVRAKVRRIINDHSTTFFADATLDDHIAEAQALMSHRGRMLLREYTFNSVADQQDYNLRKGTAAIYAVSYDDGRVHLTDIKKADPYLRKNTTAKGVPSVYQLMGGNQIRLIVIPSETGKTVRVYDKKRTPEFAFTVENSSGVAVTVTVTATQITVGATTRTFAESATVGVLAAYLTTTIANVTCTVATDCDANEPSANLEPTVFSVADGATAKTRLKLELDIVHDVALASYAAAKCFEQRSMTMLLMQYEQKFEHLLRQAKADEDDMRNEDMPFVMQEDGGTPISTLRNPPSITPGP